MAEKLAKLFCELVKSTICGHESGIYKISRQPCPIGMIPGVTASFYNHVHDTCAAKKDCKDGCAAKIKAMQDCTGHSPICLLNMLAMVTMGVHQSLDRNKMDLENYVAFMKSVAKEVDAKLEETQKAMAEMLNHECHGEKEVTPLPPGQKMFEVRERK